MNTQAQQERRDQFMVGMRNGQEDATQGRPFHPGQCTAQYEAGYRDGFESVGSYVEVPTSVAP